ncbi:uncharacterized protein DS421_13g416680 [Arachis hypogaea]|nr:uncharacterized protein DS421_13g416680 [Arachis hypogaea]
MPKKATLASARGRGVRLALPGPIRRSGSNTPTESSTQQPQQSGSSTQQLTQQSGSSTQQPTQKSIEPKHNQDKQSKADYAIPIETLLALQDQGLTKLNKKSWADICSEYAKPNHPKSFPILQRHGYVKWWSQFDASMAYPEKVREWFKSNPESQKISDPETALFLNQKAQIAAAFAGAQSKETLAKNLQQIMQMIEEDRKHKDDPTSSAESSSGYNQNEDDCFGIDLGED